ncbi:MAG: tRNA (5-methylaminomethyl-2-thiouridine)(34)-methyltransferase MnmD [Saprospiraceae bacterium]|nr:tRNA (5-methylaminomethyl-2-thiouridine)(34)-methyltransferase MnmD [Saprospiraceae bacterium]
MNRLVPTTDGSHTVESSQYGVSYHSKYGAIQESMHVFIDAGLRVAGIGKKKLAVLEAGFGTGLNALMAFIESTRHGWEIQYTGLEAYPLQPDITTQLNFTEILNLPELQPVFSRMHETPWNEVAQIAPGFELTKMQMRFEDVRFEVAFDVIFFDAFAPTAQPELWGEAVLGNMFRALKPGGILTTYCAKGAVKRQLRALGFEIESIPGPPGKREMTRARKPK